MFSIRTSFSGLRKIELVDCPSVKEWIKHDPSCDSRKWEIVCCIIVTLVMIWQWAAHGHNPAPGHTSVHSPQLRWCNIMTLLWQYVTWSGNCQDHQGDGDIAMHWRCCCGQSSGAYAGYLWLWSITISVTLVTDALLLLRRDDQRHEAWHHCATLSSLVSSERSQLINWAIAQLMIPRQNWQEVRWTWEQRGFLLCVAIKSLKGFKTFECYGYDYHLCK